MTTVIRVLYSYYKYVNEDLSDPRTNNWFLVGSPLVTLTMIGLYIHFVSVLGPALMEKRQPYDLKKIMVAYNIIQIVLNAYLACEAILLGWFWKFKIICEPVDYANTPENLRIASAVWLFYIMKIVDLVDTIFFVLRKKQNQATFLHIYHHGGMVLGTWICTRYLPGGHGTFLGVINTVVHVVMYTHYLLTSLKRAKPWWKKYITQLQLFQFFAIFVHFSLGALKTDCAYPRWALVVFLPQNLFMIILFGDFYYKTYLKKKRAKVDQNGIPNKTESKQNGVELSNGISKTY